MSYLYFWGKPIIQQHQKYQNKPNIKCIQTNQPVEQVSCGLEHAFVLTSSNELYAMGSNLHGQCGAGYLKDIPINKIAINNRSKIVSISCGWHHTIILDQLGCVLTTGSGSQGATGQGNRENCYGFRQIMTGVRKISAGMDHSLAIKGNKVWGWGNNDYGQLGLHSKKCYLTPQQLNIYPCNQLCASNKYSIFITIKGVYGCGLNNNYQLGLGSERSVNYPKTIVIGQELQTIFCGNYCLGKVKESKMWYIWGSGSFGVYKYPTKANFFQGCDKLSLGVSFGLMKKNDKIFVWGSNNYGELGNSDMFFSQQQIKDYAHESYDLSGLRMKQFCCGVNFCIGVSQQQRVIEYEDQDNNNEYNDFISQNGQRHKNNYNIGMYELKRSAKTSYNNNNDFITNNINNNNNNIKMRSVYTDYQQRQSYPYINTKSGYHNNQGKRVNNKYINQKAMSDHQINKGNKTMQTNIYRNNNHQQASSIMDHYASQQPIFGKKYQQMSRNNNNYKTQQSRSKQNQIYYLQYQNNNEDNKQNRQNIQKLRKVINLHKQSPNTHSQQSSNHSNQHLHSQYLSHQKQCQEYSHNLSRLKQLLQEVKADKQSSSECDKE